jgi:luciferase family oxidoreductase group 1
MMDSADRFPQDVIELLSYFKAVQPSQAVRAYPGAGLDVPVWILGSSLFGAQLAAALGLPFAFASHFAPDHLMSALELYRANFRPSGHLKQPHAMLGISVFAAESEAEARRLFTSLQIQFVNLRRGQPGPLRPPVESLEGYWSDTERAGVEHAMAYAVVGAHEAVHEGLQQFIDATRADELMITAQIYDHAARCRSYEIVAGVREKLSPPR